VAHSSRDIAVGSLYIQKEALGEPVPQRLRVTIEEEKKRWQTKALLERLK